MEKTATLTREIFEDKQTLGTLKVFDTSGNVIFECKTLELPWRDNKFQVSCIPNGSYKVVPRTSNKFYKHFHILDVDNRSLILIHRGNYHSDILGCVLVGQGLKDIDGDGYRDVTSSKQTMKALRDIAPEGFTLCIE